MPTRNPIVVKLNSILSSETKYMVRFIDFNGVVLKTQFVASGQSASAPLVPEHQYLTFREWNHAYSNITHDVDVGAIYDTVDGKTYMFITCTASTGLRPAIYINKSDTALMTIDWGDGTSSTTSTSGNVTITKANAYTNDGNYTLTIDTASPYVFQSYLFGNNTTYSRCLTAIYFGSNVTSIASSAFRGHTSLKYVSINRELTFISDYQFFGCSSLVCVNITSGTSQIGGSTGYVFYACYSLRYVTVPSTVTSIGGFCFSLCISFLSIVIENVTRLGTSAFKGSGLAKITLSNNLTTLNIETFYNTNLYLIQGGNGIVTFGDNCFTDTKLNEYNVADGSTTIRKYMFSIAYTLQKLKLPATITIINEGAFYNCFSLNDIRILATTPPTLSATAVMTGITASRKIYVPDAVVNDYKTATNWITFADYIFPLSTAP